MPVSRKVFSALISLLILFTAGCRQERFIQAGMIEMPRLLLPVDPGITKMSYKTRIYTSRSEISGIMVMKKMDSGAYRIAFFSEMGMSYFEASMGPGSYPYQLSFNSINPLLARGNSTGLLEVALNQVLVPGKLLNSAKAVRDDSGRIWLKARLDDSRYYFGRVDEQGQIVQSFFSKKEMPEGGLQVELEYQPGVKGLPAHILLSDKHGEVVVEMQVLE